jgi:hypothetical protein
MLDHPNVVERRLELRWCPDPEKPRMFTRHLRTLAAEARLLHGLKPTLASSTRCTRIPTTRFTSRCAPRC